MLKPEGKPFAKLRAKAAESRALVPFAMLLCQSLMDPSNEFEQTLLAATQYFNACYEQLSPQVFNQYTLATKGPNLP